MAFFNSNTADFIQIISVQLEAIGLFLAVVEIYSPNLKNKLENKIDRYNELHPVTIYRLTKHRIYRRVRFKELGCIGKIIFGIAAFLSVVVPLDYLNELNHDIQRNFNLDSWWYFLLFFIIFFVLIAVILRLVLPTIYFILGFLITVPGWIFLHLLNPIVTILNRLTGGKALGALGLILALLGFIGELYQVTLLGKESLVVVSYFTRLLPIAVLIFLLLRYSNRIIKKKERNTTENNISDDYDPHLPDSFLDNDSDYSGY